MCTEETVSPWNLVKVIHLQSDLCGKYRIKLNKYNNNNKISLLITITVCLMWKQKVIKSILF